LDAEALEAGLARQGAGDVVIHPKGAARGEGPVGGGVAGLVANAEGDRVGNGNVRESAEAVEMEGGAHGELAARPKGGHRAARVADLSRDSHLPRQGAGAEPEEEPLPAEPQQEG